MAAINKVPSHLVGELLGNPRPRVLPCGHVQLIEGMKLTTVEFETARKYAGELQKQIDEAIEQTAARHG